MGKKVVIIGASAAGVNAALTIKRIRPEFEVILLTKEDSLYFRCLLSYLLSGDIPKDKIFAWQEEIKELNIKLKTNQEVINVNAKKQELALSNKSTIGYDLLLVASGSKAKLPQIKGVNKKGVFCLREIQDAQAILSYLPNVKKAVVVGGGLIGMRAAYALAKQGKEVFVIVKSPHILIRAADKESASIIQKFLEKKAITVITGCDVEEIVGDREVSQVILDDQSKLDVELVIIGKGVIPNIDMISSEVKVNQGILVDEHLRSSQPLIYAAGDVAEAKDIITQIPAVNAIWPNAVEQGITAGRIIAGEDVEYEGSISMNSLNLFGLSFISIGSVKKEDSQEEYKYRDGEVYRRLLFEGDRLVGVILVSDIENAGIYKVLITTRINLGKFKSFVIENRIDYAKIVYLISENQDKFNKKEFRETIASLTTKY